jgi:hypothetical protein
MERDEKLTHSFLCARVARTTTDAPLDALIYFDLELSSAIEEVAPKL